MAQMPANTGAHDSHVASVMNAKRVGGGGGHGGDAASPLEWLMLGPLGLMRFGAVDSTAFMDPQMIMSTTTGSRFPGITDAFKLGNIFGSLPDSFFKDGQYTLDHYLASMQQGGEAAEQEPSHDHSHGQHEQDGHHNDERHRHEHENARREHDHGESAAQNQEHLHRQREAEKHDVHQSNYGRLDPNHGGWHEFERRMAQERDQKRYEREKYERERMGRRR